jgi:hypothetical protein
MKVCLIPFGNSCKPFSASKFYKDLRSGDVDAFMTRLRALCVDMPYKAGDKKLVKVGVEFNPIERTRGRWKYEEMDV